MDLSLNKRWAPVFLALASLVLVAAIACGGDDGDDGGGSSGGAAPATAAPAATAASAATAAPATGGGSGSAASTAAPAATVAGAAATNTPAPSGSTGGPTGSLVRAFRTLESVYGIGYVGPYRGSATNQIGGIEEALFIFDNGNPMTPFLVDTWDIDSAGTRARMTLKKGLKWQSPIGYEDKNWGELNAAELVEWFNRSNATTNPESTYGDGGDFAAIFLEAKVVDEYTIEIGLVSPVYYCLPVSQFGCLSAARGVH